MAEILEFDCLEVFVLRAALGEYLHSAPADSTITLHEVARRALGALDRGERLEPCHLELTDDDTRSLEIMLRTYKPRPIPPLMKAEIERLEKRMARERWPDA